MGLGEKYFAAHLAAAGHGGEADGHLGVLLDDLVFPAAVAFYGHHVERDLTHRHWPEAVFPRGFVEDATLHDFFRDYLFFSGFQAAEVFVDRAIALQQSALQPLPIVRRDYARKPVRRMGLVALLNPEGVLFFQ